MSEEILTSSEEILTSSEEIRCIFFARKPWSFRMIDKKMHQNLRWSEIVCH